MKIVASMNFGDFTRPNARASHIAAANRWGAQYLELTRPWGLSKMLWLSKLELHRLPVRGRVCYLDGDVVVRSDCPDLFDLTPENAVGGVQGLQAEGSEASARAWWEGISEEMGAEGMPFDPRTYLNGGVLVFDPARHAPVWELAWASATRHKRIGPMLEQTSVNVALRMLEIPLAVLPATYNRLSPPDGPMEDFVYHYASVDEKAPDRDARIDAVEWRAQEPVLCGAEGCD